MWKDKLGNYLIDVSKYVLTAVVITTIYKDFSSDKNFIYGYGILVSTLTLVTGLLLSNKKRTTDVKKMKDNQSEKNEENKDQETKDKEE